MGTTLRNVLWWVVVIVGLDSYVALVFGRTYGSQPYYTTVAALVTPLLPWWAWPIGAFLVAERNAVGASFALAIGVLVMAWRRHGRWAGAGVLALELVGFFVYASSHVLLKDTAWTRLRVWALALGDWTSSSLLVGHGVSGWTERIAYAPALIAIGRESWPVACNEFIEVFYAFGLFGLIPVLSGLWCWRSRCLDPVWGGTVTAALSSMLHYPTLHQVTLTFIAATAFCLARSERRFV